MFDLSLDLLQDESKGIDLEGQICLLPLDVIHIRIWAEEK